MSALRRLTRLGRDRRGTALMEFAFALPVLIILFLGSYQMSDAIACKRRVTIMTRAIGDMTSQYREISGTDLDTLMGASTQILAPYSAAPAKLRVTQITVESTGLVFRINWSRGRSVGAYPQGRYWATNLPAAYRQPNMTFILTESSYDYDSALSTYFSTITFSQNIWLLPRRSSTITLT